MHRMTARCASFEATMGRSGKALRSLLTKGTTSVIPKRVLSVSTCAGTVNGSEVLPSNTCTAKGSPVPVVTKPITIWVLPAFLSRLYPKAASSLQAPSMYEEVTSYKITVGAPPRCRTVRR